MVDHSNVIPVQQNDPALTGIPQKSGKTLRRELHRQWFEATSARRRKNAANCAAI